MTRTRAGDVLTVLVIYYMVSVIAACLFLAGRELYQYEKARREYDTLDKELITPIPADGSPEGTSEETPEEEVWWPQLEIDFDTYREINEDFVGILYFPLFDMRYPVVISQDNRDYLTRTFEGEENASGCIFMDYQNQRNFKDRNTRICENCGVRFRDKAVHVKYCPDCRALVRRKKKREYEQNRRDRIRGIGVGI